MNAHNREMIHTRPILDQMQTMLASDATVTNDAGDAQRPDDAEAKPRHRARM
jgi:hypothetical protein